MTDCSREAETKAKLNIAEEFLCKDTDGESLDDYYSENILQDELPSEKNESGSKTTDGQIAIKSDTGIVSNDCEKIEGIVSTHKTSDLPSKKTVRFKSVSFTDCEDINKELTKIIPERHENKANVDDGIADHAFTKIYINKPPEGKLIQEDKPVELITLDGCKTNQQPLEDMPSNTVAVEHLLSQIKDIEGLVSNNNEKTFEDTVNQFKQALQFSIVVKDKDNPTLISKDKSDKRKSIDVDDTYNNTTQDNYKDQRDKEIESKVSSVVALNADVEVVLCSVDDKNTNYGKYSPGHEKMCAIDVSANVAELTNALSESSDDEFTKTSKQFTFSDSDLPDSDEIRETLMSYPKPTIIEPFSELEEVEDSYQEEIYRFLRRRRNKIATAAMVDIMKLPERFITRHRNPVERLGISTEDSKTNAAHLLKSRYLTEQEDDIDEEIIIENIKRLKAFERQAKSISRKENYNKSNEHKETPEVTIEDGRKDAKSKSTSSGRKCVVLDKNNTKEDAAKAGADVEATPGSTSTAKTITRRTRSMKNDKDNKNTENKCKFQENKVKPESEKKRLALPEIKVRRSKRQQITKPSKSILRKSTSEQSTVYNISSSSSESPKSLKRSLVGDSDVPSPKRTRSHNANNNSSINNASLRATPARVMKTQHMLSAFPSAKIKPDTRGPFVRIVRMRAVTATVQDTVQAEELLEGNTKTRSKNTRPRRPSRKKVSEK